MSDGREVREGLKEGDGVHGQNLLVIERQAEDQSRTRHNAQ